MQTEHTKNPGSEGPSTQLAPCGCTHTHHPCPELSPQEELLVIKGGRPPAGGAGGKATSGDTLQRQWSHHQPEWNLPKPAVWGKKTQVPIRWATPHRGGRERKTTRGKGRPLPALCGRQPASGQKLTCRKCLLDEQVLSKAESSLNVGL